MNDSDEIYKAGYREAIGASKDACFETLQKLYKESKEGDDNRSRGKRDGLYTAFERVKAALLILDTQKKRDWGEIK